MSGRPRWQHMTVSSVVSEIFVCEFDGERSIVALGVQFDESGVGESQGNAVVERAIREIESMTKTLVHAGPEVP